MSNPWIGKVSRRRFLQGTAALGVGAAAAACGLPGTGGTKGGGGKKQLRILQWNHFVPAYDQWIDGWVADWGAKNKVDVTIDHIATESLPARMAAEVAARAGHDLVEMNGQILTYLYEKQLVDMTDVTDHAIKKWGAVEPIGKRLAFVNGHWVGWPNYYIDIMPQIRTDLFQQYGFDPKNVKTWDQYLEVGAKGKAAGHAAGLAISQCNDANHNWRAIMWAFGASEVADDGKTINVDTPEMRTFLKFAQEFYSRANTPEVFAWDNASDNRWLASGVGVYIHDAISSMRSIQSQNADLYSKVNLNPPVGGPKFPNGISMPDANVYVIWNFAPKANQDVAKQFLKDYIDIYPETFKQSQLYNQPMHADRYKEQLFTTEGGKYSILQNYRGSVIQTFGWPGPPNIEANSVLANYVIPLMVQKAVTSPGDTGVKAAIDFAVGQLKGIYKSK